MLDFTFKNLSSHITIFFIKMVCKLSYTIIFEYYAAVLILMSYNCANVSFIKY